MLPLQLTRATRITRVLRVIGMLKYIETFRIGEVRAWRSCTFARSVRMQCVWPGGPHWLIGCMRAAPQPVQAVEWIEQTLGNAKLNITFFVLSVRAFGLCAHGLITA